MNAPQETILADCRKLLKDILAELQIIRKGLAQQPTFHHKEAKYPTEEID